MQIAMRKMRLLGIVVEQPGKSSCNFVPIVFLENRASIEQFRIIALNTVQIRT